MEAVAGDGGKDPGPSSQIDWRNWEEHRILLYAAGS